MNSGIDDRDELQRMLADAILPPEIQPLPGAKPATPQVALLTGACGFLGRQLAYELLRHTDLKLICLVRNRPDESAQERVYRIFASLGISREDASARVEVCTGDVSVPSLGLEVDDYQRLTNRVDVIFHCAAQVDWVRSYRQLYHINAGGALSMIRLACQGRLKRLVFVSSIAVCYSRGGPALIDEGTDMLPFIDGMPLGYARSKCVAEALLRQAAARGVPVTVVRPALIAGNSATGESSPTDLIAALLQGCIATGKAMDTDWLLDCVPVDFVARIIARIPQGEAKFRVLHLVHERPRHWRELVLWMNLHGYPVDLVESELWLRHLFSDGHARGTMLYAQRRFFGGRAHERKVSQTKPYEAYLAVAQRRVSSSQTRALLKEFGLREALLDADLLHSYFAYYRQAGVLPPRSHVNGEAMTLDGLLSGVWRPGKQNGVTHRWADAERRRVSSSDGLLSEIATARVASGIGLWQLRFRTGARESESHGVMLKAKVSDRLMQDLTVQMAGVCRPKLGTLFGQFPDAIGLTGAHERELALYELDEPRLRRHIPACYGTLRDRAAERWGLLLEYMPEAEGGSVRLNLRAQDVTTHAVLAGLAEIHAVWYRRERQLISRPWLVAPPDSIRMREMSPLWHELADFAAPWFEAWCGNEIRELQSDFIADLDSWWPRLSAIPSTLIHNDFNPRNIVLRQANGQPRLCVYDWELATLGVPQHDLAELLCFALSDEASEHDLYALVELHRTGLAAASGQEIEPQTWRLGFALALRHLLINRLAMYTMLHRFRPLDYLPVAMNNWMRMYRWSENWKQYSH